MHPSAQRFLLVHTTEGLRSEFRRAAREFFGVKIVVPVQFFDTSFRWDSSSVAASAASAARTLRDEGEAMSARRARQPFTVQGAEARSADLADELFRVLRDQDSSKKIHIVVGPAGIGKSFLFATVFARLHRSFLDDKRAQRLSRRPLPLLPQYLDLSTARTVRAVLDAYLDTDFVRPLRYDTFEWLMSHGLALWLLDGLDEIIAQDPTFFDALLDLMTRPDGDSGPTILICVRDSLMATNEALREFCENFAEYVAMYRLEPWKDESLGYVTRIALTDKAPEFLRVVNSSPPLKQLATIPFYAFLLIDLFRAGHLNPVQGEIELLGRALEGIVAREYGAPKRLLDETVIKQSEVIDYLEAVAVEDLERDFTGVPAESARELAEVVVPGLSDYDAERLAIQLTQLALFSSGGIRRLRFAQEILEHYLLGLSLVRLVDVAMNNQPEPLLHRLAIRQIPYHWVTMRVLADAVRQRSTGERVLQLIHRVGNQPQAFKNLLQLATLLKPDGQFFLNLSLEQRDLSGLAFSDLDLRRVSFRGADLTNTSFSGCDLRESCFDGSIMKNTRFTLENPDGMKGATATDLIHAYSIVVEKGKILQTSAEIQEWFQQRTGNTVKLAEPCGAVRQLRHIFGKFILPSGQGRRDWLDRRGVLAGTRHADPEQVLKETLSHGYLKTDYRDRIVRPDGAAYAEAVGFVRELRLSDGLRALVTDVCRVPNCEHVPQT